MRSDVNRNIIQGGSESWWHSSDRGEKGGGGLKS